MTDIDLRQETESASVVVSSDEAQHPSQTTPGAKPERADRRVEVRRLIIQVLFTFSVMCLGFLLFVLYLSAYPERRVQNGLERALAAKFHKSKAYVGGPIPAGSPIARIDIARLGLHQVVVEGTSADQLRKGPGHLPVSPLPGQRGNAVLAGHRRAFGGPFAGIAGLKHGDVIKVLTGQGTFTYRVTGRQLVSSGDVKPFQATNDNRLTLVTAADLSASQRWVVTASLVGDPQPSPPGRAAVLSSHEGGLVGQHGALPALALWVEVLLLVAAGTFVLYRTLPRWSSYLITTPIVLAVLWLVYTNLARLLPATL